MSCISDNNILLSAVRTALVTTERQDFDDIFLHWCERDTLTDKNIDIGAVQIDQQQRRFEIPEDGENSRHEDFLGLKRTKKNDKERSITHSGDRFRIGYSETICTQNENVMVDMDSNLRNCNSNMHDIEIQQDIWDDGSVNMFTAELWVNDTVNAEKRDQANVPVANNFMCETDEINAENDLHWISVAGKSHTNYQQHTSSELLNNCMGEEIFTQDRNITIEMNNEKHDDASVVHKNTIRCVNGDDSRSESNTNYTENQKGDLDDSSHARISHQVWLNEIMHDSKKNVNSYTSDKPETKCEYDAISELKQSFTNNYTYECSTAESYNNEKETDHSIDSVNESEAPLYAVSKPEQMNLRKDNDFQSSSDPCTMAVKRATVNMVDDTYIPDDVIMEAFNIMRKHSPHLAPYIGQLPPATQHLLRNSNEAALLPYIPPDKISVNIHHIDGHWLTSVFRPQNRTVCIYDSLRQSNRILSRIRTDLAILYGPNLHIHYPMVTQQQNMPDCGAYAIAYAFSILLGIPPETQIYNVNLMRIHLKTILQSGNLMSFPVSRESNRIADYFATQSKLLSTKQNPMQTSAAKCLEKSIKPMNRTRNTRREYIKAYMQKSRSQETKQQRHLRNLENKMHMQKLRIEETAKHKHDRNRKKRVHMQKLRTEETSKQIHDRNRKNKVHMQKLRTEETSKQIHDRNRKNKMHMQKLRKEETTEHKHDRNRKKRAFMQKIKNRRKVKANA